MTANEAPLIAKEMQQLLDQVKNLNQKNFTKQELQQILNTVAAIQMQLNSKEYQAIVNPKTIESILFELNAAANFVTNLNNNSSQDFKNALDQAYDHLFQAKNFIDHVPQSLLELLPREITQEIINYVHSAKDLNAVQNVSKQFKQYSDKNFYEQSINQIFKDILFKNAHDVITEINRFRQTKHFIQLAQDYMTIEKKYLSQHKLSYNDAIKILTYLQTTADIYGVKSAVAEAAYKKIHALKYVDQEELTDVTAVNLKNLIYKEYAIPFKNVLITISLIQIKELSSDEEKSSIKYELSEKLKNRVNSRYLNLANANLENIDLSFGNLTGTNLVKTKFPNELSDVYLFSEDMLFSPDLFQREIDHLDMQLSLHPQRTLLMPLVFEQLQDFFSKYNSHMKSIQLPDDEMIKIINIALQHPFFAEAQQIKELLLEIKNQIEVENKSNSELRM